MTSIHNLKASSRKHQPSSIAWVRCQHKRIYPSTSDILSLTTPPSIEAELTFDTRSSLLADKQTETPASEEQEIFSDWKTWESIRRLSTRSLMANDICPFLEQHMMLEAMERQQDQGGAAKASNAMFCEEHEDSTVCTVVTATTTSNDENTTETAPLTLLTRKEGTIKKAWRKLFKSQRRRRKGKVATRNAIGE